MADEIIKRDENRVTVLAGITDDAAQEIRMLRVDPITGRLKLSMSGIAVSATVDVGTTTNGLPGTNAIVTNVGTTSAAIFDFTIPVGSVIYSTFGIPNVAIGVDGDWAFDTSVNAYVYYKSGGAWSQVNSLKGPQGIQGVAGPIGLTWQGSYDNAHPYVVNDGVSYLGSSYICILATTGNLPTDGTYWNLIAAKGDGTGDVNGPATNTDNYIPQWNGANSKTLKDGLAVPAGGLAGLTALATKIPFTQNALTKEPTGFTDPANVVINYDPTAQKVNLTGTVVAYYQGVDISIANPTFTTGWVSAAHPNVTGHTYFLYYNGTNFLWSDNSFPGFDMVLICYVNYDATNKFAFRECHGFMPWQDHKEFHETIGTYKTAGGTFPSASYTLNSTTAGNRRPDVDETTIYDEDCPSVLPALTSKSYTLYNLTGASIGAYTLASGDVIPLLANNPYYNTFSTPNWGQTLMPSNSVSSVWIYAMPVTSSAGSQAYRYIFIQPQWVTLAAGPSAGQIATAVAAEKLRLPSELNLGTLGIVATELLCIGRIIVDFTTNWRLQSVSVITGNKFSQIGSPSGNFLSTVATDATLTGNGTSTSPLAVANPSTGINTGDNATNTTSNSYADGKVEDAIVDGVTTKAPSQNAVFDALALKLSIAGGTMTGAITTKVGDGIIMPSGSGICLKVPATDAYCTGNYTDSFQSGATVTAAKLVYMGSSSKWLITDSDAIATSGGLLGISMESKNDTQAMKVALPGSFVRFDAWNWTPGVTLYAGETAGAIQTTIPTGADGVIRVVGFAVDADTIYFNPSSDNSTVVA